ncbi:MAG: hypothetical protein QF921_18435 [Pseudomonadales bacterium]|nr:hypothetical protein [Pseudomonadales bacterium]MDP6472353.1 hypothetical protein [Pseudomonadales bacterium]MDP6828149.1 hypothetical protein [Pseudomonadales bacterium]MDP6973466.1 hypothetical protein [Pseudomonadales bacterium]
MELTDLPLPVSRQAACPDCFEELHCCRMCSHYREDVTSRCDEDRAEPPTVKENANFCDWYRPLLGAYEDRRGEEARDARAHLDALFAENAGDEPEAEEVAQTHAPDKADEARSKLDALFGGENSNHD